MGTYVNGYVYNIAGGVSSDKIVEATENWLEENVNPATGYTIDKTLSIENAAADAKKTGDEIDDLKSALNGKADNITDYGADWSGNVSVKNVVKKDNQFTFASQTLGGYRYFSMLSDQLYVSSDNSTTSISADAFTLQNKLEPYSVYELIIKVGNNSNIGGNYVGIYDKHGHIISKSRITGLSAGSIHRTTFVNDTTPIALCMQCNGNTQSDVGELTVIIRKIQPDWVNSEETEKKILASRWTRSDPISVSTLLHFSDIHGNGKELTRILTVKNKYSPYIQDAICTGDMSLASMQSDFTFWSERDTSNILVALGNHDYYTSANDSTKADIATVTQKWIGDYSSNWGVTITSGNSYYYKDYSNGVRLIVLDCNLTDSEGGTAQKTWLENILADAKTNSKIVVIATHYVYLGASGEYTNIKSSFTNAFAPETSVSSYNWSPSIYVSTVQDFIDNGGTFVCWLSGHMHADYMSYPTNNPNQLIVTTTAATANRNNVHLTTGDLPRTEDTITEDAFNIVSIDTQNHCLKVIRIGANVNTFMESRNMICYDYSTHQFISEISSNINSAIDLANNFINYGYDRSYYDQKDNSATNSLVLGIERVNQVVTLNKNKQSSGSIYVRLNGDVTKTILPRTVDAWSDDLVYFEPGNYKATLKYMSGEISGEIAIHICEAGTHNSIGYWRGQVNMDGFHERFFTAKENVGYNIGLWMRATTILTDFKFALTIEKIESIRPQYSNEMSVTVESVVGLMTEPCLVFPMLTDIHYRSQNVSLNESQFVQTADNINYFMDKVTCDGLICLGDITDGDNTLDNIADKAISDVLSCLSKSGKPLYFTIGNHDDFRYATTYMQPNEIYNYYMRRSNTDVIYDEQSYGTNYYKDFPGMKTRLICFNTNILPTSDAKGRYGISDRTLAWVTNVLTDMPNDYIGMMITHVSINNGITHAENPYNVSNGANLRAAIRNSGKLCFVMCGHSHFDIAYKGENDPLIIMQGCAKCEGETTVEMTTVDNISGGIRYGRSADDETADLWDVVILRPFSKKLDLVRFGAGVDRSFDLTL